MKKILALLAVVFVVNFLHAQSKQENAVAAAVEGLRKAMVDGDRAGLDKWTAPELSYGHSSGKVENKAEFIENIVSGKSDFVSIDLTDQTVQLAGNAAIVRHTLSAKTNDNGNPGSVKLHILLVWQKQGGQWKLLARQAVRVP
jgi:ketosteroid isomerase-like protein